jgi:predicted ATPase
MRKPGFRPLLHSFGVNPHKLGRAVSSLSSRLPFLSSGKWEFRPSTPLTLLVGENGSGKTTFLEALAVRCGMTPKGGGSYREIDDERPPTVLSAAVEAGFMGRPPPGLFIRADSSETMLNDALEKIISIRSCATEPMSIKNDEERLEAFDEMARDLEREGRNQKRKSSRPFGESIRMPGDGEWRAVGEQSRGEGVLGLLCTVVDPSESMLFLLDEPETGLSPRRQMALLRILDEIVKDGRSQAIVATHSPLLMCHPNAEILWIDEYGINKKELADVEHWRDMSRWMKDTDGSLDRLLGDD